MKLSVIVQLGDTILAQGERELNTKEMVDLVVTTNGRPSLKAYVAALRSGGFRSEVTDVKARKTIHHYTEV